jgi:hypothetical protein
MRRALAGLLAGVAVLAGGGCGGGSEDPDRMALDRADQALAERPGDARAMEAVMRAAYEGAGARQDTGSGRYTDDARPYLDRAAAVWPAYVRATGDRPGVPFASLMVQVFGNGLARPADAADAARHVAETDPSAAAYLQLTAWAARAGDHREARMAGQRALELADPADRDDVRSRVRALVRQAG